MPDLLGSNDSSNPNHRHPHMPPPSSLLPPHPPPYAAHTNPQPVVSVSSGDKTNSADDPDDGEEDYAGAFNPFDSGTDQNDVSSKRKDQSDELSDGGGGGGSSYTIIRRSKAAAVSAGEYRKDRKEWSDGGIACLLDAYMDKFTQLNRGNLRGRDWEEVAVVVSQRLERQSKSVEQCKTKVDNLKKRKRTGEGRKKKKRRKRKRK